MITKYKDFLLESVYNIKVLGDYIYHQTDIKNAYNILKEGFKQGRELNKGEKNSGIFFSPSYRGQDGAVYRRGDTGRLAMVEVNVKGLKLFNTNDLPHDENIPSYLDSAYLMVRKIKETGIFPDGYDGIIHSLRGIFNGKVHDKYKDNIIEIIIRPGVASDNITGRLLNMKGKIIYDENTSITEAYDDVSMDDNINKRKKLSEYTDYDNKKMIGNYTYINKIDTDDDWYLWGEIKVFDNEDGTEIANASYGKQYEYSNMHPTIDVRSDKRRQGIASNIYEWIEELTNDTLYPDLPHSDSAAKLWGNPNKKFGEK